MPEGPDISAVEEALKVATQAYDELQQQGESLRRAIERLSSELVIYGAELLSQGTVADPALISRLYWLPSLPVTTINNALGLRKPGDATSVAGSRNFTLPCVDCGESVTVHATNRTNYASQLPARCEQCQQALDARVAHRARLDGADRARWEREQREIEHRAMAEYVLAHPDLPDIPSVGSLAIHVPVPEWGGMTVMVDRLHEVKRQLADRLR